MKTDAHEKQMAEEQQAIHERMGRIKHKLLVLSGKGGVGKSTVAVNLATALAMRGHTVGLLDVDIHGPSVPRLLGLENTSARLEPQGGGPSLLIPVPAAHNIRVMSIAFLLGDRDTAVIWRGPMKYKVIKQFLTDVAWGDLDYLVVDSPPGTGDEPLSVVQLIEDATGAVIVTTPQELAIADVRKCVTFCRQLDLPIVGVIENMSGFVCPSCGEQIDLFKTGGGRKMAEDLGEPFLGSVPFDPQLVEAGDGGTPYVEHFANSAAAKAFAEAVNTIVERTMPGDNRKPTGGDEKTMRIAIPVTEGRLSAHFGHCAQFALIDVKPDQKTIHKTQMMAAPAHEPGLLPRWLAEQGAEMIIAGGMGGRAQGLFQQQNISVVVGAPSEAPDAIVAAYLDGTLETGTNACDH